MPTRNNQPLHCFMILCCAALVVSTGTQNGLAQVAQLPEYRVFWTTGSVMVPDRGMTQLGSIYRDSSAFGGRRVTRFGPWRTQWSDYNTSAISSSVSATIIDHREWDRAVLQEAASRRGGEVPLDLQRELTRTRAEFIIRNLKRPNQKARSR